LAFLVWYLISNAVEVVVMALLAWSVLPKTGERPRFVPDLMRGVWRFSASISGNSLLASGLKQGDRIIITKLLPLRFLGYYAAANAAGTVLSMLTRPVATAALPRFTVLLAADDRESLAQSYHRLSQSVAVVVAPFAAIFIFFAHDILRVWTRSEEIATNGATTFSVFGFAFLLNALMQVPFALQLAAGITWIAIINNAISIALLLPLMYVLIQRFGIAGAGVSWALFNTVYFLLIPHVMHRYILPGHARRWFFQDSLPFLVGALLIGWGVRAVRESHTGPLALAAAAVAGGLLYAALVWVLSDMVRGFVRELSAKRRVSPLRPAAATIRLEHPPKA
jgi:O-antigen/teichoic acid export membrane protein